MAQISTADIGHVGKTVQFASERERSLFINDVKSTNLMMTRFGSGHYVGQFDTGKIDFSAELRNLIVAKGIAGADVVNARPLEELHEYLSPEAKRLDDSELNSVSKQFYDTSEPFLALYRLFFRDAVGALFGEDLYFQATPTLRFQFPHQGGFDWKPRIHTDIMLGHPPSEVNVWLPFTRAFGTNSMMIAGLEDSIEILEGLSYDFEKLAWRVQHDEPFWQSCAAKMRPVELQYGQYLLFDPRCLHATQNNVTDSTRISTDVRIILRRHMEALPIEYRGTGRLRMLFAPGHYYDARPISALAQ
jgi:sporadic carbohydrate cluster 2OG-Fe(II) oxygenase